MDISDAVRSVDIVRVIQKHVELKRQSAEYVGICPFHNDTHPSLKVSRKKQVFLCPVCGKAGNVYTFLKELGHTHTEAMNELTGEDIYMYVPTKEDYEKEEYKPVIPIPEGLEPNPEHFKLGMPSMTWEYRVGAGGIACYVHRYETYRGKEIRYQTYDGKIFRWKCIPRDRPLYNLHLFDSYDTIALVEGEKAADAGNVNMTGDEMLFSTWIGGVNGIGKADFSPLQGKNVILIPDNDEPGRDAMKNIIELIRCKHSFMLTVPTGLPSKWDIADKEWNTGELYQFIKKNVTKI